MANVFRAVFSLGRQRFTVMFIPHSERRIFNFHINIFSMVFVLGLTTVLVVGFFILSTHFAGTNQLLATQSQNWETAQANLETMREEVAELQKAARTFQKTLNSTLEIVGINVPDRPLAVGAQGDLSSFLGLSEVDARQIKELHDVQNIKAFLNNSIVPLTEIKNVLSAQKDLLVDIPTLWPVKGVRGRVTNLFGPAVHPFSGQWYIHKGIDIAFGYNVPIVATARGKVVTIDYEPMGFGNYVVIRHKYGFYTKYAHLQRIMVSRGQDVQQGEVIATMGNTGLSTGPHLHYEVRIGSEVVDPAKYLNISSAGTELEE
ncbi:MAG: peptidoglycan DD-metalloendopeptidase family protein [Spirochaetaceae bacterium]|nr:peptidoglycan DD-metalloendopeptidase family protein [Spirochaetaceae bacterium]